MLPRGLARVVVDAMSLRSKLPAPSPAGAWRLARIVVLAGFVCLIGRFWNPYYGFTALLQADAVTKSLLPESLRAAPLFIHRDAGRYDGAYYAQIAASPALRDPALAAAVDDLGYRARRILLSAIAWAAGGGDPVRAVHVYAWLNVILWFGFAALLWRLFPVDAGGRALLGWAGLVLASGTLASVRLALTDLAAVILLAAALHQSEKGRSAVSAGFLALGGLARETSLLGLSALLPGQRAEARGIFQRVGLILLAVLPLAGWWWYLRRAVGSSSAGTDNFSWPLLGWIGRGKELMQVTRVESNHWLVAGAWLDVIALAAQMIYLLARPHWRDPWWRLGALFTCFGLCLGPAVMEGLPGAVARVLLPLTLAFNVVAVRRRATVLWLVLGNLSVFGGVLALCDPPGEPHILTARTSWTQPDLLFETDARWSVAEWNSKWRWAWCKGTGGVNVRIWPWAPMARVELQVRGVTPRSLEVWHNQTRVWRGQIGDRPQWIRLPELPLVQGSLQLELRSEAPATGEGEANTARSVSFACFDARLVK